MRFKAFQALAVSLLVISSASAANAASVQIDFDFTSTTITVAGLLSIPPDGSIMSAAASVTAPAAGITTISSGSITFSGLTIDATVSGGAPLFAFITGSVLASQIGTAMGSLTAGLAQAAVFAPAFLNVTGGLDCAGILCGGIGTFPVNLTGNPDHQRHVHARREQHHVSGGATVMGTLTLNVGARSPRSCSSERR